MLIVFTGSWWAMALRGLAAVIFGILAFIWPGITLTALVLLFGAYALVDGAFSIIASLRAPKGFKRWWLLLIQGCLSVAAGIFAFVLPVMTAYVLLILIASWAIVTGIFEIAAAIQMRKEIKGEWLFILSGIASILFGTALLWNPVVGALVMVWLIGAYAIVFGVLMIALGFKLRGLEHAAHPMTPHPA